MLQALFKPGTRTRAQAAGPAVRIQGTFRANSVQSQGRPIDVARDATPTRPVKHPDRVGLVRIPGTAISTPRAAQAPYALECRLLEIHPVGNGLMILGEIVHIIVDESVFEGEHINSERLNLVSRLGASDWGHGGQLTSVPRISLAEFNARHQ